MVAQVTRDPTRICPHVGIHDRMPVILPPDAYTVWLASAIRDVETVQALLTPYPADAMTAYLVSTRVNNPAYDAPECIARWLDSIFSKPA